MTDAINQTRRGFMKAASLALMSAPLLTRFAEAAGAEQGRPLSSTTGASHAPFGPLRQIDAGVLNVGYVEMGPASGAPVILLHGWPYDIHSYAEVAPALAAQGYRVIVPHLRGYGTTRFLSEKSFRNGQQAALAVDVIDLMDALKIERALIGGYDWGGRSADIVAAMWPERVKAL